MTWSMQISSFISHKALQSTVTQTVVFRDNKDIFCTQCSYHDNTNRNLGQGKANKEHGLKTAFTDLLPSRGLTICNFSGIKHRRQLVLLKSVVSDWSVQREARLSVGVPQPLTPSFWSARTWIFRSHSSAKNCFSLK